jgi:hypothetical protein
MEELQEESLVRVLAESRSGSGGAEAEEVGDVGMVAFCGNR